MHFIINVSYEELRLIYGPAAKKTALEHDFQYPVIFFNISFVGSPSSSDDFIHEYDFFFHFPA